MIINFLIGQVLLLKKLLRVFSSKLKRPQLVITKETLLLSENEEVFMTLFLRNSLYEL